MQNSTLYRRLGVRTVEPPLGDVPVHGLRVVHPVPAHVRRRVLAGGHSGHGADGVGIPVVGAAAGSAASL
jgi:hypothetical protein